jgi:hypothetical protein
MFFLMQQVRGSFLKMIIQVFACDFHHWCFGQERQKGGDCWEYLGVFIILPSIVFIF